ncbi:ferric reductase-like transmembrane domain-containing protein [Thiomicrorhabdus sp. 6S3-12]|uniref:ferredoxin reductase family protein n=1 Tax=Thiomicrorhabdus sp. 6S3-12 TaxID=2819681 RepID=UPI001FB6EC5B|nr:ferric reductase-like transmembrane domain-containing protein [Thiomicrorhabdus sp. 6S3-12]
MKPIKIAFALIFLSLSGLWLLADTLLPEPMNYFAFRGVFVQYSGVIAIGVMSVAMILALRPVWLEARLNGLDKMYRLHKWLGITALVFSVLHWWWALGTKWMVGWGWLERPQRGPGSQEQLPVIEQWFRDQRGLAESLGEWAFYIAAALMILALVKWFPYQLFKKTHKWLAAVYLVLAFHSVILMDFDYWRQPVGWVMAALLQAGTLSAILVLLGRIGRGRQVRGTIQSISSYPGVHAIEGSIRLDQSWPGHEPGQFAFVTSNRSEGAHPYTIASAWDPKKPCLTFIVKELGDWTEKLHSRLHVGMPVTVEGPYGCFHFKDHQPRQIWIGAGIGITPFIARMKHLAKHPGNQKIDLFHVTADYDQQVIDKLCADAEAANIRLHLIVTPKDGRLTPEQIRETVPEWLLSSIWFCGPSGFGEHLHRDFIDHGLPGEDFHQELFAMR